MGVRIDTTVHLEDIFGEEYKFDVQDDKGKVMLTADNVSGIIKLFLRNLSNFYARSNNGKAMPFEWSERATNIAIDMKMAVDGVLDLDIADHNWLVERVKEFGTTFMQANAKQLLTWVSAMPEAPVLKDLKGGEGDG